METKVADEKPVMEHLIDLMFIQAQQLDAIWKRLVILEKKVGTTSREDMN